MDGLPAILSICGGVAFFALFIEILVYKRFIDKELKYESENKKNK